MLEDRSLKVDAIGSLFDENTKTMLRTVYRKSKGTVYIADIVNKSTLS